MASAQKKTSSSGSGSSKSGGKRSSSQSGAGSGGRSSSRRDQPQKKPYRREIGGVVCLFLALFGAIGYFKTDEGAVIALFCDLLKGLCGYGFYLTPPLLLADKGKFGRCAYYCWIAGVVALIASFLYTPAGA